MKTIITLLAGLLIGIPVFAQSPEKMSYQAVIRNDSNLLVANQPIGMQIRILQGSPGGTVVYTETHTPTSNANGLVSVAIGEGTVLSGDFTAIDWANGPYFIHTETDPNGGSNYSISGTSQLLSVPYALYAKTAGNTTPGPQGADGNGIANTLDNGDGTFTFEYTDGSTFTTSDLTGPQGADGPQGSQGVEGPQGADGNGIANTLDNGDGTFTFEYTDGSTFTTSDLTGPQGAAGVDGADGILPDGTAAGNTPFWNGSTWVTDNGFLYNDGTRVGVGTSTPNATLDVSGTVEADAFKTRILTAGGTNDVLLPAATGNYLPLSDLNLSFDLDQPTDVILSYQVSYMMSSCTGFVTTQVRINGVEQPYLRSIQGTTAYGTCSGALSLTLPAGSYTVVVEYRSSCPVYVRPQGQGFETRMLQAHVLGR